MGIAVLDDGFPENRKVAKLHDRAFRFHVTALCYCARNLTDGHVDAMAVKVIAAILETQAKRWAAELVGAGLWVHDKGGDGFWINDYHVHNPTAEALKKKRDQARAKGIRGAEKRWGKQQPDSPGDSPSYSSGQMPSVQNRTDQNQGLFPDAPPMPHLRPVEQPGEGDEMRESA